jgi:hypothetical protein
MSLVIDGELVVGNHFYKRSGLIVMTPFNPKGIQKIRDQKQGRFNARETFIGETRWIQKCLGGECQPIAKLHYEFLNILPRYTLDSFEARDIAVNRYFLEGGKMSDNNNNYIAYMETRKKTALLIMKELRMSNINDLENLSEKIDSSELGCQFIVDGLLSWTGLEILDGDVFFKYESRNKLDNFILVDNY